MIIKVKNTDYIVGVWMAEQVYLGKVFVYSIKGKSSNEWTKYIKYIYVNHGYNMYMHDNDHQNILTHKKLTEIDIIKICNQKIDELSILFCHNKEKILIGGDLEKYKKIAIKNKWLLPISEIQDV